MIPQEDVSTRILALAEESPNKTISGGRLSELLKHHVPGFNLNDYGAKNLRAFIRDHLSGKLNELGKVGTDIVYGLPGAVPAETQQKGASNAKITQEVARVFRSPNAPFELHANRDTGLIRVVEKGSAIQDSWVRVTPASSETLREIARGFASEMPEDDRRQLMRIFDDYPNAWWPRFSIYIQEKNLCKQWIGFKSRRLNSALEVELHNLGIIRTGITQVASEPESRPQAFIPHADSIEDASPSDELRDVILRVVQKLAISELRELKFPVGDVYDALKQRK